MTMRLAPTWRGDGPKLAPPFRRLKSGPPERHLAAAAWSARFGALALPVLAITVVGHRAGKIDTESAFVLAGLALLMAAVAVALGLAAAVKIWNDGDRGGADAAKGFLLGAAVLAPFVAMAGLALTTPRLTQVTTDFEDPPLLAVAARTRTARMNPVTAPDAEQARLQLAAYPQIKPRIYRSPPSRVQTTARDLVKKRGWTILDESVPRRDRDPGRIEALARTRILGFPDDVAIRIRNDRRGTVVDMRSLSRYGLHDLGANAARIESFFADLDAALGEEGA